MAERKPMHLKDLFKTGKEVKLELELDDEEIEIVMWMRKPTASQRDEALNKARGKQARRKALYKDKNSDQYMGLWAEVDNLESREDIIDQLVQFDAQRLQSQAFNEVLHDDEHKPRDEDGELMWGDDNIQYLDLLEGIYNRMDEIRKYNEELEDEDEELIIHFDEDDELVAMKKQRDEFEGYVQARYEVLLEDFKGQFADQQISELRDLLLKKLIQTETGMAWYEEYQTRMLYHACRDPKDKGQPYFSSHEDLLDLPPLVLTYLEDQLNELDQGGENLKNLRSPQNSSS